MEYGPNSLYIPVIGWCLRPSQPCAVVDQVQWCANPNPDLDLNLDSSLFVAGFGFGFRPQTRWIWIWIQEKREWIWIWIWIQDKGVDLDWDWDSRCPDLHITGVYQNFKAILSDLTFHLDFTKTLPIPSGSSRHHTEWHSETRKGASINRCST